MDLEDRIALVNKPPIEEIVHFDLVNKPPIDELYHYGVLNMHWGIRRYQNPDGSLTPEGLRRQREKQKADREKILNDPSKLKKHLNEFSEEEIERALKNFDFKRRLKEVDLSKKRAGKKAVEDFVNTVIKSGEKANDIIKFLNSSAGKLLRESLGFGTDDIGNFKTKKDRDKEREENAKKQQEKKEKQDKKKAEDAAARLAEQKVKAEIQQLQYKNYMEWLALPESERKKIPRPNIYSM